MWQYSRTQNVTTLKLKIQQNSKTQNVTKFKNSTCAKTLKLKFLIKTLKLKFKKTQNVTKLKNSKFEEKTQNITTQKLKI